MRLALLSITSATVVGFVALPVPNLPDRSVRPVQASIAPPASTKDVGRRAGAVQLPAPAIAAAKAAAYAIPADQPRPPLGRFKLTAYSGPQLGQAKPITATGTTARTGRTVAVDPDVIPLGSKIYIEGVGVRIAEDVGGGVRGHHVDVYLHTVPQARKFGVRRGTVRVIELPRSSG
jgi:3D (Asp-Asp-Asp) domain-containing protein